MSTSNKPARKIKPPKGESYVLGASAALAITLMMTFTLIGVILFNGLGHFWLNPITQIELVDGTKALGELNRVDKNNARPQTQYKIGNRDLYGEDFRWYTTSNIVNKVQPEDAIVLERMEYGNFYGFLKAYEGPETIASTATTATTDTTATTSTGGTNGAEPSEQWDGFLKSLHSVHKKHESYAGDRKLQRKISDRLERVEKRIKKINYAVSQKKLAGETEYGKEEKKLAAAEADAEDLIAESIKVGTIIDDAEESIRKNVATFVDINGQEKAVPLVDIVRANQPNTMGMWAKTKVYLSKIKELLLEQPRESNTEGGLFPAIFGTVMMVFIMSLFCIPFGVIAAVYLREYAKEGVLVQIVRIAVNNLAGVPSIVYGVFGMGFFIYTVGGWIDGTFYPWSGTEPVFGKSGILWASLTLALLTVPVVIVSTEEALAAIPKGTREGSLALGATKWQTILKVSLPQASPGIMTGFILAMSRAAGEVAPLMVTGAVKYAPKLPVDGNFPFVHLERSFMHLGFHIFDIGFQPPNVEAVKPMVYVTTLLLILIVIALNITAIKMRNSMRKKFAGGTF